MNTQTIADALDKTIATVAEQEFNRLCRGLNDFQVAEQVAIALDELEKLQGRGSPDYNNDWVALFYVTWYQPRQINVALAILRQLYEETLHEETKTNHPVEIIDVGCGALSVQFATAIAATEHQHTDVSVHGIDPSHPMKRIGETLWSEFCAIIVEQPDLLGLLQTCNLMTDSCDLFDSFDSYLSTDHNLGYYPSPSFLLLAVHVLYDSNRLGIQETLQNFHNIAPPFSMFIACHKSKSDIAESVIGGHNSLQRLEPTELPLQGALPKTSEWRRYLRERLPEGSLEPKEYYLQRKVMWTVLGSPTLIYGKEPHLSMERSGNNECPGPTNLAL